MGCSFSARKQDLTKDPQQISPYILLYSYHMWSCLITRQMGKHFLTGPIALQNRPGVLIVGKQGRMATGRHFAVSVIHAPSFPTFITVQSVFYTSSNIVQSISSPLQSFKQLPIAFKIIFTFPGLQKLSRPVSPWQFPWTCYASFLLSLPPPSHGASVPLSDVLGPSPSACRDPPHLSRLG